MKTRLINLCAIVITTIAVSLFAVSCEKDEIKQGRPDHAGIPDHAKIPDHVNLPDATGIKRIKDIDGNVYPIVKIGEQWWMAEKLKTTRYNDGTGIGYLPEEGVSTTKGTYAWYDDNFEQYGSVYGALYDSYAVHSGKLCPVGWHIPVDGEWIILTEYLGGYEVAGGKMKTVGTIVAGDGLWDDPNIDATNESGWSGLPGGGVYLRKRFLPDVPYVFDGIGSYGLWWSIAGPEPRPLTELVHDSSEFGEIPEPGSIAFVTPYSSSVRCVRD